MNSIVCFHVLQAIKHWTVHAWKHLGTTLDGACSNCSVPSDANDKELTIMAVSIIFIELVF